MTQFVRVRFQRSEGAEGRAYKTGIRGTQEHSQEWLCHKEDKPIKTKSGGLGELDCKRATKKNQGDEERRVGGVAS